VLVKNGQTDSLFLPCLCTIFAVFMFCVTAYQIAKMFAPR